MYTIRNEFHLSWKLRTSNDWETGFYMNRKKFENYDDFIKKFNKTRGGHKLTTDDCYTPDDVYNIVLDWVINTYNLPNDTKIIRPFYPGGNYKEFDYPADCVVVDNPPFSILANIRKWYMKQGTRYFLFCPTLTSLYKKHEDCLVITEQKITYTNGALVNTSFATNLDDKNAIVTAPDLSLLLKQAKSQEVKSSKRIEKKYPKNVVSLATLGRLVRRGGYVEIPKNSCATIREIEAEKNVGLEAFGRKLLVANNIAEDIDEKLKLPTINTEEYVLELSNTEREIVEQLGKGDHGVWSL